MVAAVRFVFLFVTLGIAVARDGCICDPLNYLRPSDLADLKTLKSERMPASIATKIGCKSGRNEVGQDEPAARRPTATLPYTTILAWDPESGQVIAERHRFMVTALQLDFYPIGIQ